MRMSGPAWSLTELWRWLALVLMSSWRNIISSFSEYWVPGISILQEKTVCRDSEVAFTVEFTTTSYMRPRLMVVVVASAWVGLQNEKIVMRKH